MTTHPTHARESRAHHPTPDPNGPHNGAQGPLNAASGTAAGWTDPWEARSLLDVLDSGERTCRGAALQWTRWAAELAALRARMPGTPGLLDDDGTGSTPITRATHIDPAAVRGQLAGPLAAADHLAAVYVRHAELLADAIADAYPPPDPNTLGPGTDGGGW